MKKGYLIGLWAILLAIPGMVIARQNMSPKKPGLTVPTAVQKITENCDPPTSRAVLDINNVRTTILGGNDMWWDLDGERYEIPKEIDPAKPKRHSLFAGSVWVGGLSEGVLKVAAQTYRQTTVLGVGWWSGPLNVTTAKTTRESCITFDRHWKVEGSDIDIHKGNTVATGNVNDPFALVEGYTPPLVFLEWPAKGDPRFRHDANLAPFVDLNGNGEYEPLKGDYPDIYGDQSIWFVTNDAGGVAGSGSKAIGMEIQTQAFAYVSNDELNNMTFYTNKIVNRSTSKLDSCYMAQWVDPDLGNAADDYVACDVPRGLGIVFNGDENDENTSTQFGYGLNPPSLGVDFFEGPFSDPNDGIDNDRDCVVDEIDTSGCDTEARTERMIMSKFMYFTNGASYPFGDPSNSEEAYNFMRGKWQDGTQLTYGGNGFGGTIPADMVFPGASDQEVGWSAGGNCQNPIANLPEWSEFLVGNQPNDRRFVQSGGPFSLEAGAVNYITIGVVWAKATSGGPRGSFNLLLDADSKAQALFDNCFQALKGPDAPDINIVELDRELILNLTYKKNANNFGLGYNEIDPAVKALNDQDPNANLDETYNFQGLVIYQLVSDNVTTGELDNADRARLVYQCDIKDLVGRIVNYERDVELDIDVPTANPAIANNSGINLSVQLLNDAFTNTKFVNNKSYHFLAVAYGYNQYRPYDLGLKTGQGRPYLAGRGNIKITTGIPHKVAPNFGGMILNSTYGDSPEITRYEGTGNGGRFLDITAETEADILANGSTESIKYTRNFGPIDVKVIDPVHIVKNDYVLSMYTGTPTSATSVSANSRWYITYNNNTDTIFSDTTIAVKNQQILQDAFFNILGLAVEIENIAAPGKSNADNNNGFIGASIEYTDGSKAWLSGLPDIDIAAGSDIDWIKAGVAIGDRTGDDDNEIYENILPVDLGFGGLSGGTWTPYRFAGFGPFGAAIPHATAGLVPLATLSNPLDKNIQSVDIVMTNDESKWSQCLVLEMGGIIANNEGNQTRFRPRKNTADLTQMGFGTFPGYAINVETGERLNIMFGEDSGDPSNNGRDMKWNPTDSAILSGQGVVDKWGGSHNLYIMKTKYDGCAQYQKNMTKDNTIATIASNNDAKLWQNFREVMWVSMPITIRGAKFLGTDARVKLRVSRNYEKSTIAASNPLNNNNPRFGFNTNNLAPVLGDNTTAINALDLINAVPNPYYAYSSYENSRLDNRVRITNLPQKCTVRIYNMSGSLIRTINKDAVLNYVDWDLKNEARVPIAGGAYIIHVDAGDLGEKVIKWFGIMRPTDLTTF